MLYSVKSKRAFHFLLALSFVPFLFKGIAYLSAESYAPIILPYIFGVPILHAAYFRKPWLPVVVKLWAAVLMLYGLARMALGLVLQYENVGVEAQIMDQLTYGFGLTSLGYAAAGFYFWRNSKKRVSHF